MFSNNRINNELSDDICNFGFETIWRLFFHKLKAYIMSGQAT